MLQAVLLCDASGGGRQRAAGFGFTNDLEPNALASRSLQNFVALYKNGI